MTRRLFYQLVSASIAGVLSKTRSQDQAWIKPRKLQEGDKIGLITPGSPVPPEKIEQSIITCQKLGLQPVLGKNIHESTGYLAGTDEQRLGDLHSMFSNPDIKGIWCIRGGYGCTRLLPAIDYDLIRQNPKILIGYSDITALHLAIGKICRLVTYHGPVSSSKPTSYTIDMLKKTVLNEDASALSIHSTPEAADQIKVIRPGSVNGTVTGGNLSLLSAMAGTRWSPDFSGRIVCIEDIGEKPYRIDRMLVQLFQSTDLSKAAGIILGQFTDCEAKPNEKSFTLEQTLRYQFRDFNGPVLYGFSFGHIDDQCTLPFGISSRFDTDEKILHLLESPTLH